jgi:methyl-accepting chemotaxis protein
MAVPLTSSINFRFNLTTMVLLLLLLAGFGSYNHFKTQDTLNDQLDQNVSAAVERLSLSVPGTLWNYEFDQLATIVDSEMEGVSVGGIYIFNDSGERVIGRRVGSDGALVDSESVPEDAVSTQEEALIYDGTNEVGTLVVLADHRNVIALQRESLVRTVVQTVIMILSIGVAIALLTHRLVTGPIQQVQAALEDIAKGEGDLTQRLAIRRQDEVGAVAGAFNDFVSQVQTLVKQVVETTGRISASSDQMQHLAARTSSGVNNQRVETDQVATAMNEMGATAHDVAESANNAAKAASQGDEEGARARSIVNAATDAIRTLAVEIDSGAKVINELDQAVGDITSMIDVISGIAEQTNLLALNAAIEAARAGEQGRGFAVVADEVRSLASRTQNSTGEIRDKIQNLQQGAKRAVDVMQQSKARGEATVEKASMAEEALGGVAKAISTINDMNVQIASAAEEQTAVVEEINRSLMCIVEIANEASNDTQSTEAASDEMTQMAHHLGELVGKFKV